MESGSDTEQVLTEPQGPSKAQPGIRARRTLAVGAAFVIGGLALVGTSHPDLGGWVLMGGWAALAAGIHRFGRG